SSSRSSAAGSSAASRSAWCAGITRSLCPWTRVVTRAVTRARSRRVELRRLLVLLPRPASGSSGAQPTAVAVHPGAPLGVAVVRGGGREHADRLHSLGRQRRQGERVRTAAGVPGGHDVLDPERVEHL